MRAAMPGALAAQDAPPLRDFSLPPAPTPTARPQVQGPVDPDAPVPATPRVIAPRTTATPAPRPVIRLPEPVPAATANPRPPRPAPATSAAAAVTPARPLPPAAIPAERTSQPTFAQDLPPTPPIAATPQASAPAAASPLPSAIPAAPDAPREQGSSLAPFLLAALGIAAAIGGAAWWRRRRATVRPVAIERPLVPANDDDGVGAAGRDPLKIELAAVKLTRSFMNATLSYRITLHNRSGRALANVAVAGELIGAHGSQPLESQIASSGTVLPELHRVERLSPGQSRTVDGAMTLPVGAITPIRQGPAALFVPLLRLVVTGDGVEPLARTFVVGQPGVGQTGRLTPFRLDEPPRSYQPLGQRALD